MDGTILTIVLTATITATTTILVGKFFGLPKAVGNLLKSFWPIRLEGVRTSGGVEVTYTNRTPRVRMIKKVMLTADGQPVPPEGDVRRFGEDRASVYGPFNLLPDHSRMAAYPIRQEVRKVTIRAKVTGRWWPVTTKVS